MAVNPTEKQEEYIDDNMKGGTLLDLNYDFEPSESFKNYTIENFAWTKMIEGYHKAFKTMEKESKSQ